MRLFVGALGTTAVVLLEDKLANLGEAHLANVDCREEWVVVENITACDIASEDIREAYAAEVVERNLGCETIGIGVVGECIDCKVCYAILRCKGVGVTLYGA